MTSLLRIVLALLAVVLPVLAVRHVVSWLVPGTPAAGAVPALLSIVVGFLGYAAYVRWVEKRPLAEFAPEGAFGDVGSGVLLGAVLFSGTIGILALLGVYHVTALGRVSDLMAALAGAIGAGVLEEILFRGVIFRIVEEALGSWIALGVSAAIFGFLHLVNPHGTLQGAIAIIFEAGIVLAAAYMLTRRLWLPIGIHVGWNFTQGGVFGAAVSGSAASGLLHGTLTGPDWLSGGVFGPEASVVAIALCTTAGLALLVAGGRRGSFRQPLWRKRSLA
jgi:membrane protease YdiL (CAAX protease family)